MPRIYDPAKLKSDCANCDALCCIAFKLPYDDYQKPAGIACKNLDENKCRCTIHGELEQRNYSSCTQFDCRGAGVAVSYLFRTMGRTWITDPKVAHVELNTFIIVYYTVLKHLHPDLSFEYDPPKNLPEDIKPFIDAALDLLTVESAKQT